MEQVGLIGCGFWGRNLARVLHQLGRLQAICDINSDFAGPIAQQYGVPLEQSFETLLEQEPVSIFAIATPAATHFDLAARALVAGKDVFVEKPLALQAEQAEKLADLANKHGRILMVGHLLQYHSAFAKLLEIVDAGELGRLRYIYSHRLNLGKIRSEENILWSFAPHDISMILALAREMPEWVEATGHCALHGRIADTTTTNLTFPSGMQAHIFVSWLHPFKEQKLVVVGDRAMAVFDDTKSLAEKLMLYPHSIDWRAGKPEPVQASGVPVALSETEPLYAEMEHFLDCCDTRATPRTDAAEGIRVLKVLNSAQSSMDARNRAAIAPQIPATRLTSAWIDPSAFVHKTADIDDNVTIGAGTKIWHYSHLLRDTTIGSDCVIGQNVMIGPNVTVGRGCKIQNNVSIYQGVTLEDEVFCGPSCVFTNVLTPRAAVERKNEFVSTLVQRGATIGANATIVCGNTVGAYAMVGAGAVVTQDVPAHALVVGNPARQVGWVSETGDRLGDDLICPRTGKRYEVASRGTLVEAAKAAS